MSEQAAEFFEEGFENLITRYDTRLNKNGDYVNNC